MTTAVAWSSCARWLLLSASLAAALAVSLYSPSARAIPAFARRYETSCQTCHVAFPKLTPFGEAFRRNAYRFPEGGDAVAEKEEPVTLGNDAQKDLFPRSVWPGQIAGKLPISLLLDMRADYGSKFEGHAEESGHGHADGGHGGAAPAEKRKLRFDEIGGKAALLGGGGLGSFGGWFAAIAFGHHAPVEVERGFVIVTPHDQTSLHLKVGRFEPALHGVSLHRGLLGHQLRLTTTPTLLNGFTPEGSLRGFEASGLVLGRIGWFLGVVESTVRVEGLTKDFYGRLEAKVGGMRLDGHGGAAESAAWRERSFTIGASSYRGRGSVTDVSSRPGWVLTHTDAFTRVGGDVHAVIDDLMVDVVVAVQRHDAAGPYAAGSARMLLAYGEVTYVTLPWLFPTLRGEASQLTRGDVRDGTRWIGILALNAVVRANILVRAEIAHGADPNAKAGFRFAALNLSAAF
ncbi:MAG: hypothetical protein HYV09_05480 [Deltaproteobacteria bacterium]|nr:hypothetical protein [Deltaproteobacteria bacterium]